MGGNWAEWDDMVEETMYLFLSHQFSDLLEQAWGKCTEFREPDAAPVETPSKRSRTSPPEETPSKRSRTAPPEETQSKRRRTSPPEEPPEKPGGAGPPGGRAPGSKLNWGATHRLKQDILQETGAAAKIMDLITSNALGWASLDNDPHGNQLQDTLASFQTAMTSFGQSLLVSELRDARAKWGHEYVHVRVEKFLELKAKLVEVTKQRQRLVRTNTAQQE